jgi:hypothetical protein
VLRPETTPILAQKRFAAIFSKQNTLRQRSRQLAHGWLQNLTLLTQLNNNAPATALAYLSH